MGARGCAPLGAGRAARCSRLVGRLGPGRWRPAPGPLCALCEAQCQLLWARGPGRCRVTHGDLCASRVLAGNSSECPPPGNAADDTVCLDLGKCKDGKCVPFCEREQQRESCACNGECTSVPRPCSRIGAGHACLAPPAGWGGGEIPAGGGAGQRGLGAPSSSASGPVR